MSASRRGRFVHARIAGAPPVVAVSLIAFALLTAAGCEGIGLPVVGDRPGGPPVPTDTCTSLPCDAELVTFRSRWQREQLGAELANCPDRHSIVLEPGTPVDAADLRCGDVFFTSEEPFELDLREAQLSGARIHVSSSALGVVWLPAATDSIDLRVEGPVEVHMRSGALGSARIALEGREPERLPTLWLDRVLVTDVALEAPRGSLRAHASQLAHTHLVLDSLVLELSSLSDATVVAQDVSLLDVHVVGVDFDATRFVHAAGRIEESQVVRCERLAISSSTVSESRIAACIEGIALYDVDSDTSIYEGDLRGSANIRRGRFLGRRIELTDSRLTVPSFCGVEVLDVAFTSIECPTCEPAAPAEICGVEPRPEPYCPGYASSPCQGQPRPTP